MTPSWRWRFVEFLALSGLTFAQPCFDVTGKNSEVLVVHGTTWPQAVALALLIVFAPPLLALAVEGVASLVDRRTVPAVHAVLCGIFLGVLALEVTKGQTSLGPAALVATGCVLGIAGGFFVWRFAMVRQFLHFVAVMSVGFALLFLFSSPASDVLNGSRSGAPAATRPRSPTRVVLIVLDELPTMSLLDGTGNIDRALFPNFAALADHATWYRSHTTVAGFTAGAVPAILTGRYPAKPNVLPILSEYPQNLFTLTGRYGDVNGHEAITRLCPSTMCGNRGRDFASLTSATWKLWTDFASPVRTVARPVDEDQARASVASGEEFVRSLRRGSGLQVDVAHLEIPHFPWERLPSLQRYDVATAPAGESYGVTPRGPGAASARMRHLLQVQAADTMVGRVVQRLTRLRSYDRSLVIVTADHGASFTPGESVRNPSPKNLAGIMWAPLLVKYPGQRAGVIDERRSESVDIVPTIADVIGLQIPWTVDGQSLRGAPPVRPVRRLYPWIWLPSPTDVQPPSGRTYIDVPGDVEYREVMTAAASRTSGDPHLRVFRIGPYGSMIGSQVSAYGHGPASTLRAQIVDPGRFDRVDVHASKLPWVWNEGMVQGMRRSSWLAVAANGRIVAVAEPILVADGRARFSFLIPPLLVEAGRNHVVVYVIGGPPSAPTLAPIRTPLGG